MKSQKTALNSLELELWAGVSYLMWVLGTPSALNCFFSSATGLYNLKMQLLFLKTGIRLASNSLGRERWPWTSDPPSCFQVLGLKMCLTTLSFKWCWRLNLGLCAREASTLPTELHPQCKLMLFSSKKNESIQQSQVSKETKTRFAVAWADDQVLHSQAAEIPRGLALLVLAFKIKQNHVSLINGYGVWELTHVIQTLGSQGRKITTSLRLLWAAQWVSGQPELKDPVSKAKTAKANSSTQRLFCFCLSTAS